MAIETQPERAQAAAPGPARPWWLRAAFHTGLIGGVAGYLFGHWLGNALFHTNSAFATGLSDTKDMPIVLGYAFGVIGWLAGL
ncbi:MAG TPA: hypothetical protein VIV12_27410, partial [Streptosporangiaceae bacterium]